MEKVILITGASKGIGYAAAKMLAEKGYKVYGGARSPFSLSGVTALPLDITDADSVREAVKTVIAREGRLDAVVNNAGMGISGPVEYASDKDVAYILDVNFTGAVRVVRETLPYLRRSRGKIVNVSSVAGPLAIPFQGFYSASKCALDALALALHGELKPFGIRVTNVMPGDTKTSFTDARRKQYTAGDKPTDAPDPVYGDRVRRSVEIMERDERNGKPPETAAKVICRVLARKKPPLKVTVGFTYKLFIALNKFLPKAFVCFIVNKIYAK
jgi:NAD(P)-dependent dehydrogenase (short-subunit alcohol dehydrogenase family)